ncbi:MAG: response regulator transcription factor [Oscillospiraceae bacterium]|nr:response regulator transcription factor [Oscillospiraceae bacterium]
MIRAAICDDEKDMIDHMREHIMNECKKQNIEIVIDGFVSGEAFLKAHKKNAFDVVFLDIDMPEINGFDIAESINDREGALIVFVTTHDELVYSSIKFRPFRFIRKPYLESELPESLAAVNTEISKRNAGRKFPLRTKTGEIFLDVGNIEYIEIYGHWLRVAVFKDEFPECYGSLSTLEKQLAGFDFVRVHKSYLVNLKYIYAIEKTQIVLDDKTTIPLSRYKAAEVKAKFKSYLRSAL